LTEGTLVVHVVCVSENEFKAWLSGEVEPSACYPTFEQAVYVACQSQSESRKRKLGQRARVFTPIMNHFLVGEPLSTNERCSLSEEGERLISTFVVKPKRARDTNDDDHN
jgi:hypothetical protein